MQIEVRNLKKQFGRTVAVKDLSFTVKSGSTLVLLGTSGCGKTTTLKMINRLIKPTSGDILFDGSPTARYSATEIRRKIGYVIQKGGLFPHYTVRQNITLLPDLLGWPSSQKAQRVDLLAEKLHIDRTLLDRYPHELSGGQQQRVSLARALAANPPVMLLDEPFGALDPITRTHIQDEFLQLDELQDTTTLIVTHDVSEACKLADVICLMDAGKIRQMGSPKELLFQPADEFVRSFFDHKRLELQFKLLSISELTDWLPLAQAPFTQSLDPKASVADALTHFSRADHPLAYAHRGQHYLITPASLMEANSQYLSSLAVS
ncbi:ATP-binding cassette domain-containing protein [Pontibacter sp. G13]|uniref:ABC transporter ATP-binding protein n=1 Tax=Pontibacter sp. G13 TaxID=3074898 RepID=UPI00288AE9F3|nr:ATP-binding cassette domain-containing protein [Pontibacter sp. G13]WNJ17780.1 ATP-binding cassette domain-containing protein [Pontibacter sp. G13]